MIKPVKGSLSHRLIFSSLLIFAVILIICTSVFFYLLSALQSNYSEIDQQNAMAWQRWYDESLQGLQLYVASLNSNPVNTELKAAEEPFERIPQSVFWFYDTIRNYENTNYLLSGLYIWYPSIDLIVGAAGCFSSSSYYALVNGLSKDGETIYFNSVANSNTGFHLIAGLDGNLRFCYIYPMYTRTGVAGYIVAEIDTASFFRLLGLDQEDVFCRVLMNGSVIAQSSSSTPSFYSDARIYRYTSDVSRDLVYEYAVNQNSRLNDSLVALAVIGVGIITSILIAYFGTRRAMIYGSRPVSDILCLLDLEPDVSPEEAVASLQTLREKEKSYEELLRIQERKLGSAFLQDVLVNRLASTSAVSESMDNYSVKLDCSDFVCMVITSKRDSNASMMEKISSSFPNVITTVVQDRVAVLFLYDGSLDFSDFVADSAIVGKDWKIGVGLSYSSISNISVSYSEALLALEYAKAGEYHIYSHGDYELIPQEEIDVVRLFIAELQMERFSEALRYLDDVFESLFDHSEDPVLRKVKAKGIADQLQAYIDINGISYESEKILKECILNILNTLIKEKTQNMTIEEDGNVAQKAMKIIMVKFTDPMFGLSALSEMIGCSNTYLSAQFKVEYGIGISRYIQKLRIEKAKELLENKDMKIKDIAFAVGFSSDIAFLRVFRKLEGTTPGNMRRHQEDEPSDS